MVDDSEEFHNRLNKTGNILLQRSEIGKVRPSPNPLPQEQFSYGKPNNRTVEGAGALLSSWHTHTSSERARSKEIDYQRMNRLGVKVGAVNARQQTAVKGQIAQCRRYRYGQSQRHPSTDHVVSKAGVPTKPSTPIYGVVGNLYGRVAHEVQNAVYKRPVTSITAKKIRAHRGTRGTSLLQAHVADKYLKSPENKKPFQMAKFSHASAKVTSYRDNARLNQTFS